MLFYRKVACIVLIISNLLRLFVYLAKELQRQYNQQKISLQLQYEMNLENFNCISMHLGLIPIVWL